MVNIFACIYKLVSLFPMISSDSSNTVLSNINKNVETIALQQTLRYWHSNIDTGIPMYSWIVATIECNDRPNWIRNRILEIIHFTKLKTFLLSINWRNATYPQHKMIQNGSCFVDYFIGIARTIDYQNFAIVGIRSFIVWGKKNKFILAK